MKVFITLERDENDNKNDAMVISACLDLEETLKINDVPCQLKITSLPRKYREITSLPRKYRGFKPASELDNIEKE